MDKTLELIRKAQQGNKLSRDQLVEKNIGLIWSIVKRFGGRGYEMDDLFQIGSIGLIKAIDKFDLSYNVKFSTYAVPMIMGEIKRFIRDDSMIKVSRSLKETALKVKLARDYLSKKNGQEPTIEEIANEINISIEDIIMALESNLEVESLYKTIHQGDGNPIYLIDKIEHMFDENEMMIDKLALREVIDTLTPKEKELITLRYYEDKTQTEIAKKIGISQVQVSRLEKKILNQIKEKLS